jgi:hypothetical protein
MTLSRARPADPALARRTVLLTQRSGRLSPTLPCYPERPSHAGHESWRNMNLVGRTERRGRDEAPCRCGSLVPCTCAIDEASTAPSPARRPGPRYRRRRRWWRSDRSGGGHPWWSENRQDREQHRGRHHQRSASPTAHRPSSDGCQQGRPEKDRPCRVRSRRRSADVGVRVTGTGFGAMGRAGPPPAPSPGRHCWPAGRPGPARRSQTDPAAPAGWASWSP